MLCDELVRVLDVGIVVVPSTRHLVCPRRHGVEDAFYDSSTDPAHVGGSATAEGESGECRVVSSS